MMPAFLMSLPPPSNPPNSKSPPKRHRPSHLARKYRRAAELDDTSLVGHPSLPPPISARSPVRFSRFPATWEEALNQTLTSVCTAVGEGHDRVRVDLLHPERIPSASVFAGLDPVGRRTALLVEAICATLKQMFQMDPKLSCNFAMPFCPNRAILYFNSVQEADVGAKIIPEDLQDKVECHVLGQGPRHGNRNEVLVLVAPTNRMGNPSHLESVEAVHYSNWTYQKIVLMVNPDLIALTRFSTFDGEPRQPCFLTDYLECYYIDPVVYPSQTVSGAILRCFPRKWEMYMRRVAGEGFRLVAEQQKRFSAEKIRCEFGWSVDPDMEKAVML